MTDPNFEVSKQAIEDVSQQTKSEADCENKDFTGFEISGQAVKDLGGVAGHLTSATELLADREQEKQKETPPSLTAEGLESERLKRNFSFVDGETRFVFDQLSYLAKFKAISLRQKMIDKLGSQIEENGIGLLSIASKDSYLVHLGDPPQNLPVISHSPSGRIMTRHTPFQSECAYIRYFGRKHRIVNLYDIPDIDPVILNRSMGKGVDYWEKLLPDLSEIDKMRSGTSWRSWVPTIKL